MANMWWEPVEFRGAAHPAPWHTVSTRSTRRLLDAIGTVLGDGARRAAFDRRRPTVSRDAG
jgi:hypothetical protein